MSELKRWIAEDATAVEAQLLEAARGGGPTPASRARMAKALRAATMGAAAGAGAAAAVQLARGASAGTKHAALTFAKWVAVAAFVGSAAAVAWRISYDARETSPDASTTAHAVTPDPPSSNLSVADATPPGLEVITAPRPHSLRPPGTAAAVGRTPSRPNEDDDASEPFASASSSLDSELRLLEEAKSKLDSGSPAGALALVSEYRRRHPRGVLALEAEVLRIDALVAAGRRSEAKRTAAAFVLAHPHAAQTPRLTTLATSIE